MAKLKVEKIFDDAKLPNKPVSNTCSGYDVYAYKVEKLYVHGGGNGESCFTTPEQFQMRQVDNNTFELQCNERVLINTGIKATVEDGYEIQVRPRSGLALKQGLTVLNSPGTIDAEYRDFIGVILINTSRKMQEFKLGDAIAQIVPAKVELLDVEECKLDDNTKRGKGGFGHSDEKSKTTSKNEEKDDV